MLITGGVFQCKVENKNYKVNIGFARYGALYVVVGWCATNR